MLRDSIIGHIRAEAPDVSIYISRYEPVVGAVLLALEEIGVAITSALYANLDATMPAQAIFDT